MAEWIIVFEDIGQYSYFEEVWHDSIFMVDVTLDLAVILIPLRVFAIVKSVRRPFFISVRFIDRPTAINFRNPKGLSFYASIARGSSDMNVGFRFYGLHRGLN